MGIGKTLNNELTQWGVLAILIVVLLIVFNKFSETGQAVSGLGNGTGSINQSIQDFVTSFSTGISEPKNWVAIFVIALIGFGVIKYVKSKN